ncbi:superoxide dismutase family protein [Desertivirga brevis]|uniref:superoxide dismutase family protein n=1 Tax=Desertivirga brevis TaxID=2810310 RepID=UPI001F604F3F|nr:superoxide dismutase family protein [Pedobacter sp. SYSU D00873]
MSEAAFTRKMTAMAIIGSSLLAFSCSSLKGGSTREARATINSTKQEVPGSGSITFVQKQNEVEMKLEINFPAKANKTVAVHIHEHGDCGNQGNDAHGHWNPTNSKHGKWGSGEYHLGDIGNVQLDAAGKGSLSIKTDKWSVGTGNSNDVAGRGLIVHDGTDDYVTQPTGNAGSRIGCGVIEVAKK